jgi:hypothetical protein
MKRNLQSVAQFSANGPFTENQLRWWIFNAAQNGLAAAGAIVRIGRRIYLDVDGFDRWLATQNAQEAA